MEFLLSPDMIYVMIAGGLMLALLALAAPGTGLLEGIAGLVLLGAGAGVIYNSQVINGWAVVVLLLGIAGFVLALFRPRQRFLLALAVLLITGGSAYVFRGPAWWQPGVTPWLAGLVSLLLGGFFWLAGRKVIEAWRIKPAHTLALLNRTGEAKTAIHKEGSVQVAGELWSAYSDQPLPRGARVRVVKRDGFRLKVEEDAPLER